MPSLTCLFSSLKPWEVDSQHFKFLEPTKHQAQRDFLGQLISMNMKKLSQHLPKLIEYSLLCDPLDV